MKSTEKIIVEFAADEKLKKKYPLFSIRVTPLSHRQMLNFAFSLDLIACVDVSYNAMLDDEKVKEYAAKAVVKRYLEELVEILPILKKNPHLTDKKLWKLVEEERKKNESIN